MPYSPSRFVLFSPTCSFVLRYSFMQLPLLCVSFTRLTWFHKTRVHTTLHWNACPQALEWATLDSQHLPIPNMSLFAVYFKTVCEHLWVLIQFFHSNFRFWSDRKPWPIWVISNLYKSIDETWFLQTITRFTICLGKLCVETFWTYVWSKQNTAHDFKNNIVKHQGGRIMLSS